MSSVFNHVPSRSRVSSLRAAHLLSSRVWPKELYYNRLSYSGYLTAVCTQPGPWFLLDMNPRVTKYTRSEMVISTHLVSSGVGCGFSLN
ncbi:hypothetical protein RU639_000308 [Aspergillus parasiticus]